MASSECVSHKHLKVALLMCVLTFAIAICGILQSISSCSWRNTGDAKKLEIHYHHLINNGIILSGPALTNRAGITSCVGGHVIGFPPVCGADGCLQILQKPQLPKKSQNVTITQDQISRIEKINGWMHSVHINMVSHITAMQHRLGIYGSVGEIGVHHGKFSSVLALNTATREGERFFVCDIFEQQEHNIDKSGKGDESIFATNLQHVGFYLNDEGTDDTRIRVWRDSSVYLSKAAFLAMGLPAFRMISIDGSHQAAIVLNDMVKAACVLRHGGVVIMDDVFNSFKTDVTKATKDYFALYGEKGIVPFLFLENKLYLTTKEWVSTYISSIKNVPLPGYKLEIRLVDKLGVKFSYLMPPNA